MVDDSRDARRTAYLCNRNPLLAAIRTLLLEIEQAGEDLGWDNVHGRPYLFAIDENPRTEVATWRPAEGLSNIVHTIVHRQGGRGVERALLWMVTFVEAALDGRLDDQISEEYLRQLQAMRPEPGQDVLSGGADGSRLYGYGLRHEVVVGDLDPNTPQGRANAAAAAEGRLSEQPGVESMRVVTLAGRDGLLWLVTRSPGEQPTARALLPDSDSGARGAIFHAITRLTNAMVGNPVPITPSLTVADLYAAGLPQPPRWQPPV